MPIKTFAAALLALFLAACNPMAQLEQSEQRIEKWHETYNTGDARRLYGQTSDEFREVTSIEQMNDLIALVTQKMGAVESTERTSFNINSHNGVTSTTVTMATVFEKGEGVETFTFQGTGDDTRLVAWNVDSPNFLDVPQEAVTPVEGEAAAAK